MTIRTNDFVLANDRPVDVRKLDQRIKYLACHCARCDRLGAVFHLGPGGRPVALTVQEALDGLRRQGWCLYLPLTLALCPDCVERGAAIQVGWLEAERRSQERAHDALDALQQAVEAQRDLYL